MEKPKLDTLLRSPLAKPFVDAGIPPEQVVQHVGAILQKLQEDALGLGREPMPKTYLDYARTRIPALTSTGPLGLGIPLTPDKAAAQARVEWQTMLRVQRELEQEGKPLPQADLEDTAQALLPVLDAVLARQGGQVRGSQILQRLAAEIKGALQSIGADASDAHVQAVLNRVLTLRRRAAPQPTTR